MTRTTNVSRTFSREHQGQNVSSLYELQYVGPQPSGSNLGQETGAPGLREVSRIDGGLRVVLGDGDVLGTLRPRMVLFLKRYRGDSTKERLQARRVPTRRHYR